MSEKFIMLSYDVLWKRQQEKLHHKLFMSFNGRSLKDASLNPKKKVQHYERFFRHKSVGKLTMNNLNFCEPFFLEIWDEKLKI